MSYRTLTVRQIDAIVGLLTSLGRRVIRLQACCGLVHAFTMTDLRCCEIRGQSGRLAVSTSEAANDNSLPLHNAVRCPDYPGDSQLRGLPILVELAL